MEIVWSPRAIKDLIPIRQYIERERPEAASRVAQRIRSAVRLLAEHPHMGHIGIECISGISYGAKSKIVK
jgi:plasmid stabilization system protein ParE